MKKLFVLAMSVVSLCAQENNYSYFTKDVDSSFVGNMIAPNGETITYISPVNAIQFGDSAGSGSDVAVAYNSSNIKAWASGYTNYTAGTIENQVDDKWKVPENIIGAITKIDTTENHFISPCDAKLTVYELNENSSLYPNLSPMSWSNDYIIMIGGPAFQRSPLNAYIDKVQFYNKALSQANIIKSMSSPLSRDTSLLGYWNFEDGCTTDAEGFMQADKGSVKAAMYKILTNGVMSIGTEVKPFTFGEGVDPKSVIQGVEENVVSESKTKAFVSNEMLNIENAEGINSVVVYDAMGKVITSANANGATSTQIALTSNTKGLLIVKINNDVVKVICD